MHEREHDARFRKIRATLQRARKQLRRTLQFTPPVQELSQVVVGEWVAGFGLQRSFMTGHRAVDISERFEADAEVDVRLRIFRRLGHRLPVELASLVEFARLLKPVTFLDQPVCGVAAFF